VTLNDRRSGGEYGTTLMDRHPRPPGQGMARGADGLIDITGGGRITLGDDVVGPRRTQALHPLAGTGPPVPGDELAQRRG
jgi:hypothetical protein